MFDSQYVHLIKPCEDAKTERDIVNHYPREEVPSSTASRVTLSKFPKPMLQCPNRIYSKRYHRHPNSNPATPDSYRLSFSKDILTPISRLTPLVLPIMHRPQFQEPPLRTRLTPQAGAPPRLQRLIDHRRVRNCRRNDRL
jgi:hypothetical protein